jgi:hypothetical protein
MKVINHLSTFHFIGILLVVLFALPALHCKKTIIEHPFTDIATLDCRNLVIRSVTLKDSIITVALENTCKNCNDGFVYLGMIMLNRQQLSDTLAKSPCLTCLSAPRNGETMLYELKTKLTSLPPDMKKVRFDFDYLCTDVTYLPK